MAQLNPASLADAAPLVDAAPLLGGLTPGAALRGGHHVIGIDTGSGLTLWLRGPHGAVQIDVFPASSAQPGVSTTAHFRVSYRGGLPTKEGKALCDDLAQVVAREEVSWLAAARVSAASSRRVRRVQGGAALQLRLADGVAFHALNPYVGCLVGCAFCYAQGQLQPWRSLLGLPAAGWGAWVDVRTDLPSRLRAALRTEPRLPIKVTPIVADPYQAIETRERITRGCLEVLAETASPPPLMLSTRSTLVLQDLPLLSRIPGVRVGMSVPTLDPAVCRTLEPAAATPGERLKTLAALRAAGIETFAVAQPMLPGDPEALADALAAVADSVTLDTLHGTYAAAPLFQVEPLRQAADPAWQRERLHTMHAALVARGVPMWRGELPPALRSATG